MKGMITSRKPASSTSLFRQSEGVFGTTHSSREHEIASAVRRLARRTNALRGSARATHFLVFRYCDTAFAVALLASFIATAVFSPPFSVYLTEIFEPSFRPS